MNAPVVKLQAQRLAERLAKEEPGDERARIDRLFLLTVNRPADAAATESAIAFLDACSQDAGAHPEARAGAWTELCHAILGSNQFLFRE